MQLLGTCLAVMIPPVGSSDVIPLRASAIWEGVPGPRKNKIGCCPKK